MSTHQALLFSKLSDKVTFVNHAPEKLSAENRELLSALEVEVIDSSVTRLAVNDSGQVSSLSLENGTDFAVQAVVVASQVTANASIYLELGGELSENPMGTFISAEQTGATGIPGVYAAGNVASIGAMVGASAAAGTMSGAFINAELAMETAKKKMAQNRVKA
jgi:thioredoxin reductase